MTKEHCILQVTEESKAGYAAYAYAWRKFVEDLQKLGIVEVANLIEEWSIAPMDDVDDIKRMGIDFPDKTRPEIRQEFEAYWFGEGKPGGPKPAKPEGE